VKKELDRTRQSTVRRDQNVNTSRLGLRPDSRPEVVGDIAFGPTGPEAPIGQRKNSGGRQTSQSTKDITILTRSASISQDYNQKETSGLRATQAVRLDSNLGDFPTVFSRAPESHFFLNNLINTSDSTISEQVDRKPNNIYEDDINISRRKLTCNSREFDPKGNEDQSRRSDKRLKTESPAWTPDDQTIQSLRCFGANLRSMVAPANSYSLNKFLEEEVPDLMFVVETWHREPLLLPNRGYNILLSPADGERAGGVGIISRYPLIVMPLFPEFHTRNLILARLSSKNTNPILLLCVYIPPDLDRKKEMIGHICRVIEFLNERYSSFSLLGFGDLNTFHILLASTDVS